MIAHQVTINRAPFSLGSHPQKRPHESSAHKPPSTVPTKLSNKAKQVTPYIILSISIEASEFNRFVKNPMIIKNIPIAPAINVAIYPSVTVITCVANQNRVSNTA